MTMTAVREESHDGSGSLYGNGCRGAKCRRAWAQYTREKRAFVRENGQLVSNWRQLARQHDDNDRETR